MLQYVKYDKEKDEWDITERFLEFKDFYKKTRSEIAEMIEFFVSMELTSVIAEDRDMTTGQICQGR